MSHEHSGSLEEHFAKAIASYAEAKEDGTISLRDALHIGAEVTHAACELLCKLDNPLTHKEDLVRAAEAAFDKYFEPLNLIGVPDGLVETYVDGQLRNQIRPAVSIAIDMIGE